MNTYTKINTSYCRYQNITRDNCPNEKWLKWHNQIILGKFSDEVINYLKNCMFEGYEKIDGTNSKICFFPSTGDIRVGGKTDKASSMHGQFEMLQEIADRIQPKMCELFPKESARFAPVKNKETNKVQYYIASAEDTLDIKYFKEEEAISALHMVKDPKFSSVEMEEVPIYIYGEYFGTGIQKCGGRYSDKNDFRVFDIDVQGWWIPKELRDKYCEELGLKQVPFLGYHTFLEFESMVKKGFKTTVDGVKDDTLMAEGIVARPVIPIRDSRGNRIIVKIKSCDYNAYDQVMKEFTSEEFAQFNMWYFENIEPKNDRY